MTNDSSEQSAKEITQEEKDKIIREVAELSAKNILTIFKMLGLKTHIEVMIVNKPTSEEFILSFKTVPKFLKDKIESSPAEQEELWEEVLEACLDNENEKEFKEEVQSKFTIQRNL